MKSACFPFFPALTTPLSNSCAPARLPNKGLYESCIFIRTGAHRKEGNMTSRYYRRFVVEKRALFLSLLAAGVVLSIGMMATGAAAAQGSARINPGLQRPRAIPRQRARPLPKSPSLSCHGFRKCAQIGGLDRSIAQRSLNARRTLLHGKCTT
jgi:hypothetical protein